MQCYGLPAVVPLGMIYLNTMDFGKQLMPAFANGEMMAP